MPEIEQASPPSFLDLVWRTMYRFGFPLARLWWRLRLPRHKGALVAIHVGPALLLVRSSYRAEWSFPGGGVLPGEVPEAAARRELFEEIGLAVPTLLPAGLAHGTWDGRCDEVHFFELLLNQLPTLQLDNREIISARLVLPDDLGGMMLTGPVAAYLARASAPGCRMPSQA